MSINNLDQQVRWLAGDLAGQGAPTADQTLRRYQRAHARAWFAAALSRLRGRSTALLSAAELLDRPISGARSAGLRMVPIRRIIASEGRSQDFDQRFRPLHTRTWDRWRDLALAAMRGAALPPVELIQVGEHYIVRDGHHRISVAAANGQAEIDAVVTVVELVAPAALAACAQAVYNGG